jgi:taurine dioxygenase
MKIELPKGSGTGANVTDVDVRRLTPAQTTELKSAVYRHKLLVFCDQALDDDEYIALARKLGTPQVYLQPHYHHPQHPEIFVSSNVLEDGKKVGVAGTGQYWHTDYQFMPEPLSTTMVYPKLLPNGPRETYYIDMQRVYERLPLGLRARLAGLRAIHEAKWRYKITADDIDRALVDMLSLVEQHAPPVSHPAVIEHPVTGASSLYISSGFTTGFIGLSHGENEDLLRTLIDFIERPEHVHAQPWRREDILYWDNRSLIHKASRTPPGEQSKSYRIGVYDEYPFYTNGTIAQTQLTTGKDVRLSWLTVPRESPQTL